MALPYTTPPSSHPGTPMNISRPGSPSKYHHRPGFPGFLTAIIQDTSNHAVREKQHLSTSRSSSSSSASSSHHYRHPALPRYLRPLAPYINFVPIPIPATTKSLVLPVPALLTATSTRASLGPSTPRRMGGGDHGRNGVGSASRTRIRPTPMGFLVLLLTLFFLLAKIKRHSHGISIPFVPSSTNILSTEQIARVWQWEIGRGHYPSSRRTPTSVNLAGIRNPGVDASTWDYHPEEGEVRKKGLPRGPSRFPAEFPGLEALQPVGPKRHYLNITRDSKEVALASAYPPRPRPNSVIDLDIVMDHCDFTTNKYVRDCLEVLRTAANLDGQPRLRRGNMDQWRHLYYEDTPAKEATDFDSSSRSRSGSSSDSWDGSDGRDVMESLGYVQKDPHALTPVLAKDHQKVLGLGAGGEMGTPDNGQIAQNLRPPNLKDRQNIVGFGAAARPHPTHPTADPMCDPDYPRIFHIFWAGPFTDKPYLAVSSFLYTQNLALHLQPDSAGKQDFLRTTCRPQLWVWINPGPAASLPNPRARSQMFDQLRANPWSAPFLHERFSEVVRFKMWNTTEQLDNIPELRSYWRDLPLFNSGGVKYGTPAQAGDDGANDDGDGDEGIDSQTTAEAEGVVPESQEEELGRFGSDALDKDAEGLDEALAVKGQGLNATAVPPSEGKRTPGITSLPQPKKKTKKSEDELLNRVGSTSSKGYDRLTVVLSDMARFVLTHRFGGVYLDADTIFLRDWEELWGWKGAFAYRWSRLEKYNTAVLKMHRNSAIGSFLFKSALANGLDFHPMTISRYTKDASLEGLLLRLPDALFDSAWLNTEYYQRDRPPYPYFKRFEDFFDPPKEDSAAPLALGFDAFFRGAFSYHFHNFWWIPFDPARNWPDLGERFSAGEKVARARAIQAKLASEQAGQATATGQTSGPSPTRPPHNAGGINAPVAGPTGANQRLTQKTNAYIEPEDLTIDDDDVKDDERDLGWATVLKRTFEAYLREERPNMYGEWIQY